MFCSPSALVALKKKMWCYFCEQRHLTKKMQSACIQYPNFYGFVLWNLNVYKTTALIFFFYIINAKTLKPALYLSFILFNINVEEVLEITKNIPISFIGKILNIYS
jgi:hypothetical protein